jgi:hypothetical protein
VASTLVQAAVSNVLNHVSFAVFKDVRRLLRNRPSTLLHCLLTLLLPLLLLLLCLQTLRERPTSKFVMDLWRTHGPVGSSRDSLSAAPLN